MRQASRGLTLVSMTAAVLLAASPATAQQSTTTCGPELGRWVCRTTPQQSGMGAFFEGQERARQSVDSVLAARQANQDRAEAERREYFRRGLEQQVAAMVSNGQCEDAKRHALDNGDMALAEQAMRLCTPR